MTNQKLSPIYDVESSKLPFDLVIAETDKDLLEAYRLRYEVFVDQLGEAQRYADHAHRIIEEPMDEYGINMNVYDEKGIIASLRLNPWKHLPSRLMDPTRRIPSYICRTGLELPFVIDRRLVSSGAKFCVAARARDLTFSVNGERMSLGTWMSYRALDVLLGQGSEIHIGTCSDELMNYYRSWGYRFLKRAVPCTFDRRPEKKSNLMYLIHHDVEFLKQVKAKQSGYVSSSEEQIERAERMAKQLDSVL